MCVHIMFHRVSRICVIHNHNLYFYVHNTHKSSLSQAVSLTTGGPWVNSRSTNKYPTNTQHIRT